MKAFIPLLTIVTVGLLLLQQGAAINCGQVEVSLIQCMGYLTGHNGSPSPPCCDGVKKVKGMAQTTADKRATCKCIKTAAAHYSDLKDEAAKSLPTKCGVQLQVPISRSTDCNKIN